MAKIIYKIKNEYNREAEKIEFKIPDDLNIHEFKTMCIRLASSMGYQPETIKKAFSTSENTTKSYDNDLRQLFRELNINMVSSGSMEYGYGR